MTKRSEELLTMTEVAKKVGLSRQRVHIIAQRGKLKHKRLGKSCLVFKRRDVEAWLQSRQTMEAQAA